MSAPATSESFQPEIARLLGKLDRDWPPFISDGITLAESAGEPATAKP